MGEDGLLVTPISSILFLEFASQISLRLMLLAFVQKEGFKCKDRDPPVQRKEHIKNQTGKKCRKNTKKISKNQVPLE